MPNEPPLAQASARKPGRKPLGEQPLTGAQRQARYRRRHPATPVIRYRRPIDRRSRPQRWRDAVDELLALQAIIDLDLNEIAGVEPPRGFGRD